MLAIKIELYFVLKYNSRLDEDWMRKKEESGFAPKDRPKKWRQECKITIKQIIENKLDYIYFLFSHVLRQDIDLPTTWIHVPKALLYSACSLN